MASAAAPSSPAPPQTPAVVQARSSPSPVALQQAQAKRGSQVAELSKENKENEAPQRKHCAAQTKSCTLGGLQDITDEVTTPMPLARPVLEISPEALPKAPMAAQSFEVPASESSVAAAAPVPVPVPVPEVVAEPVRGLSQLTRLDLFDGEMPVKNTFINFPTASPPTRATTKPLSSDTEPKNFAPRSFSVQDRDQDEGDLQQYVAAFLGAAPEPQMPAQNPVVISLQESLASAPPAPKAPASRIQLNLSLWIPSASSRASAASEPPTRVRLAQHHFPVSAAAPSAAPAAAPTALATAAAPDGGADDDAVRRRLLFQHNSI